MAHIDLYLHNPHQAFFGIDASINTKVDTDADAQCSLVFTLSCLPDWDSSASVTWGIFNFTFLDAPIDFLDLDHLAKISIAWLYLDPESLRLTINVKLAQWGRHHSGSQEIRNCWGPRFNLRWK